jgi:hypothetical protein
MYNNLKAEASVTLGRCRCRLERRMAVEFKEIQHEAVD